MKWKLTQEVREAVKGSRKFIIHYVLGKNPDHPYSLAVQVKGDPVPVFIGAYESLIAATTHAEMLDETPGAVQSD